MRKYHLHLDRHCQTRWPASLPFRERADAVASLRQARAESMQVSTPKAASPEGSLAGPISLVPQPSSLDLAAGIGDLMAALKPRRSQAGGGASEDGSSAMSGALHIGSYRPPESVPFAAFLAELKTFSQ